MKLDYEPWIYGLVSDVVKGGATAVVTGFALPTIAPEHFTGKVYETMLAVFCIHAAVSFVSYLKLHPLPQVKTVTTTEQREAHTSTVTTKDGMTVERSPHSTVITKVEETRPASTVPAVPADSVGTPVVEAPVTVVAPKP